VHRWKESPLKTKRVFAADIGASGGKFFTGTFRRDQFEMEEVHRFDHRGVAFYIADRKGVISERCYWDDVLLYSNLVTALRKYRHSISDTLDSIGFDTWGSDGQFIGSDGDLIGRVYCYRDHRLDDMIGAVKERIDPGRIYEITGIHFQPFNLSNQLLWFMQNRREQLTPGAVFIPMPSLFYYYLGNVKVVDSSWASVTQIMDARKKRWSEEILENLGIPPEVMPPIVKPGELIGKILPPIAASLGLNRASLVSVGSHDTASAYAAAPVNSPEEALIISSGTWSLIGRLIDEPITTPEAMAVNVSNEGGINNVRFLKNCMGTWIVQELRRIWKERDGFQIGWNEVTRMVEKAEPFTAFIDPDDPGFYNPQNMEEAIVSFCKRTGQKIPSSRESFLRVVYESLAMKYRMVDEQLSRVCSTPSRVVHIVGGGCKNELLNQFTSDALGKRVVAGPREATAVGNMAVQAVGLGLFEDPGAARTVMLQSFSLKKYTPKNTRLWLKSYEDFTKIV
jgi:sugar (pentulose or hexulose) kinase